ncbi:MAG TPA: pilin [Patescibacteria group bacterium]|nr:pilin [Patescibacteria group bacterium]
MKKITKFVSWLTSGLIFMAVTVKNPAPGLFSDLFGDSPEIKNIIPQIISIVLGFAGLVAIAYVILGGFQLVTSRGSSEQAEKGRKTLTNAIIGLVIIILSYVIVSIVTNAAFGNVG